MTPAARRAIETLLARELATAVSATVPLTGWAQTLTDAIASILEDRK